MKIRKKIKVKACVSIKFQEPNSKGNRIGKLEKCQQNALSELYRNTILSETAICFMRTILIFNRKIQGSHFSSRSVPHASNQLNFAQYPVNTMLLEIRWKSHWNPVKSARHFMEIYRFPVKGQGSITAFLLSTPIRMKFTWCVWHHQTNPQPHFQVCQLKIVWVTAGQSWEKSSLSFSMILGTFWAVSPEPHGISRETKA